VPAQRFRDQRIRDIAALLLLVAASLPLALLARHIAYDDAWITYRYAWNLAAGNGFVYNVGERFLGTSAPGYAVLLALGAIVSPDLVPAVSGALCAVSLVAIAVGFYAFTRTTDEWVVGLVAGLLFVVNPTTLEAFGGEMLLQVAVVIWAFVAEANRRWMWAVVLGVIATLIRPDGIVPLGLIGLHQTWVRRQLPWREMFVAGAVLAVWHAALWGYFGAPLPETVGAKNAQRLSGIWRPFGSDLVDWFKGFTVYEPHWYPSRPITGFTATVWLALAGLVALLWTRRWWVVLLWPVIYMLAYRQLHLPFYHWYALVPMIGLFVPVGAVASVLGRVLAFVIDPQPDPAETGISRRTLVEGATALLFVVCLVVPTWRYSAGVTSAFPNRVELAYAALGDWFAAHTPNGASVGYLEIGIVGYHARRPIVDPLGLVNPGIAPHVARRDFLLAYSQ
jgi:arabinofuranosyltransferase